MAETALRLHLANPCAFCGGDPCRCADGRPKILPPEQLLRLGALTLQAERSEAVERLLEDQAAVYVTKSKEELVEALVARDALLAHQGRQIADGRTGSRLLREFMRAALYQAEGKGSIEAAEAAIRRLGGEEADARQLKLHGSTLGPLESPEAVAGKLASGEKKSR